MTDAGSDPHAREQELARLIGRTIGGKYKVLRLIGRGGMGAVYEAEHETIGRRVAVKVVDREFAQDDRVVGRFAREARAASTIESDHIVSVFDAGTDEGHPYIVMELLRGEDVGARLRRRGRLSLDETLHIIAQVLRGLARAHAAGIVHRDLKPDNVLLVERDADSAFVKIVDFGISKIQRLEGKTPFSITAQGVVLGTPLFMSPEQAQALPDVDERSDLYSAGAILFECLTGRPPHVAATEEQIILAICMTDAPDIRAFAPSVPAPLARFIARALERDRGERFQTAVQMLAALREVAPNEPAAQPLKGMEYAATVVDQRSPVSDEAKGSAGTLVLGGEAARGSSPSSSGPAASSAPSGPQPGGKTDVSWSTGGLRRAGVPARSRTTAPHVPVMVAAFLATVTGVVATVWVVTAMQHRGAPPESDLTAASAKATVPASAATASAPGPTAATTTPPTSTSTSTTTTTPATTMTSTSGAGAAASTSTKPATGATRASKGGAAKLPSRTPEAAAAHPTPPPQPKPAGTTLDIQRDLP